MLKGGTPVMAKKKAAKKVTKKKAAKKAVTRGQYGGRRKG
jgi:hypothetical protein